MLKLSVAHLRWRAPLPSSQRAGDTVDPSVAGRIRSDVVATTSPGLSRTRRVWYGEMMVGVTAGGVTRGANGERVAGRTPEFFSEPGAAHAAGRATKRGPFSIEAASWKRI